VALTKADKPAPDDLAAVVEATERVLARRPAAYPGILVTSATTGLGIDILRAEIAELAGL
jgi:GTP-binding protein